MVSLLVLLLAAATCFVSGCSLTKFDRAKCSKTEDCRESFGFGFTCGQDGFCVNPFNEGGVVRRCAATYPTDLFGDPADFDNPSKYVDAIVVGNLMDRSSPKKNARELAARLAMLQANETNALNGRQFGIIFCTIEENLAYDDLTLEQAAIASAQWLTQTIGVPAIIGPSGSSATKAVYQSLINSGTLVISPSATSANLTELDTTNASDEAPGLLWRTAPPDTTQVPVIVADMNVRKLNHVAVVHETDDYGQGLADLFSQTFGGQISLFPFMSENERTEVLTQAGNTAAEEVLFIASNSDDVIAFINGAGANSGYDTKSIFLTDSAASNDVFQASLNARSLFQRIRGTRVRPLSNGFAYQTFLAGYQGAYSQDAAQFSFTAQAYDAAWLVIYGSTWSLFRNGNVTGRGIAQGLRKVSCQSDGATQPCHGTALDIVPSTYPTVVDNFRTGTAVELSGASGDLNYDLATEETTAAIEVWKVTDNGAVVPAW